jgi:hypothetical protein
MPDDLKTELDEILGQFTYNCRKIEQAAKFIQFFIHDIIDYSIL